MSWGQSGSMPVLLLRKDLCNRICMKEYYVQDKLTIVRTDWKLHVKAQNESEIKWSYVLRLAMNMQKVSEAGPVTWSMRCWRRQWCWRCGCCRFCCRWRHANCVPAGDQATAKLLVNQPGEGGYNYEVSCDWRFQPPNPLLKQEGLQPAKASFRDNLQYRYSTVSLFWTCSSAPHTSAHYPLIRAYQSVGACM